MKIQNGKYSREGIPSVTALNAPREFHGIGGEVTVPASAHVRNKIGGLRPALAELVVEHARLKHQCRGFNLLTVLYLEERIGYSLPNARATAAAIDSAPKSARALSLSIDSFRSISPSEQSM